MRRKYRFTDEFNDILERIKDGENIFISGKAGTGKSFLITIIKGLLSKKYAVVAPTGIAAKNVGGRTIHSLFGLKVPSFFDVGKYKVSRKKELENIELKRYSVQYLYSNPPYFLFKYWEMKGLE